METLVVVAHHRNHHQYCGKNRSHGSTKYRSFGSPPSANFRAINCRTFQSGAGLLSTPFSSDTTPVNKKAFSASLSPQTPSPSFIENKEFSKRAVKSNTTIPVPLKINFQEERDFHFSELWAGPTYSNSPPPSSLPIPKFSLRPKRTVSFNLPAMASEIDLHPAAKSAPASPTRERSSSPEDLFETVDSATKTLRRILNLDINDE